jgi:hypothetical protein
VTPGVRFGEGLTTRSVSAGAGCHAVAMVSEFMNEHVNQEKRFRRVVRESNDERSVFGLLTPHALGYGQRLASRGNGTRVCGV